MKWHILQQKQVFNVFGLVGIFSIEFHEARMKFILRMWISSNPQISSEINKISIFRSLGKPSNFVTFSDFCVQKFRFYKNVISTSFLNKNNAWYVRSNINISPLILSVFFEIMYLDCILVSFALQDIVEIGFSWRKKSDRITYTNC